MAALIPLLWKTPAVLNQHIQKDIGLAVGLVNIQPIDPPYHKQKHSEQGDHGYHDKLPL